MDRSSLRDFWVKERDVIAGAPTLTFFLFLAGVAIGTAIAGLFFHERIETLTARIEDYKERLGLSTREGRYAKATNNELKRDATAFLARLKDFDKRSSTAMRTSEDISAVLDAINQEFGHSFRADGVNLRNELKRRVEVQAPTGPLPFVAAWDFGTLAGANAIGEAITEIERLVNLLPDRRQLR
jgi:hypothetical protein